MSIIFTDEALRTIGRDLQSRGIKTYRIRCERGFFAVDGAYQAPPAATPVSLYYSRRDLSELDRKAQQQNYLSATRAFIYLPDILAAVASYVSHKRGRLSIVDNSASSATLIILDVEYETLLGSRRSDRLTTSTIYTLCMKQQGRRAKTENLNPIGRLRNSLHEWL
jgi:hypothetical protein